MQMSRTTTKPPHTGLHILKSPWAARLHQGLPVFSRTSLEGRLTVTERTEGNRSSRASPAQSASLTQKKNNLKNQTNKQKIQTRKTHRSILHKQNSLMKKKNSHNPKSRCCPLCVNTGNCRHTTRGVSTVAPLQPSTVRATSRLAVLRAVCQIKPFTFYFCLKWENPSLTCPKHPNRDFDFFFKFWGSGIRQEIDDQTS